MDYSKDFEVLCVVTDAVTSQCRQSLPLHEIYPRSTPGMRLLEAEYDSQAVLVQV